MKKINLSVLAMAIIFGMGSVYAGNDNDDDNNNHNHHHNHHNNNDQQDQQQEQEQNQVQLQVQSTEVSNDSSSDSNANNESNNSNTLIIGGTEYSQEEGGSGGSTLSPTSSSEATGGSVTINNGLTESQARDLSAPTDSSVNVSTNYDAQDRNPVNTAHAPELVTSDDTCMGSSSVGGQGITFGLSFGTTWKDDDCVIRKDARFLHNAQRPIIALSLMCEKDSVKNAVKLSGTVEEKKACGL